MNIEEFYDQIGGSFSNALARLRKETLISKYVRIFAQDDNYEKLAPSIDAKDWDTAFLAAHSIKGMAANLEFTPLFEASSELCENLRGKNPDESLLPQQLENTKREYTRVLDAFSKLDE